MGFRQEKLRLQTTLVSVCGTRVIDMALYHVDGQCNSGTGNGRYFGSKLVIKENGEKKEFSGCERLEFSGVKALKIFRTPMERLKEQTCHNNKGKWEAENSYKVVLQLEKEEKPTVFFSC